MNAPATAQRLAARYGTAQAVYLTDARISRIQLWGGHKLYRARFWGDVWIALTTMHAGRTRG